MSRNSEFNRMDPPPSYSIDNDYQQIDRLLHSWLARKRGLCQQDRNEIASDAIIRVIKKLDSTRLVRQDHLLQNLKQLLIDFWRKRKRRPIALISEEQLACIADEIHEERFLNEVAIEMVLNSLPADDARLFRLHFIENVRLEELAREYGKHRATICRWLNRICKRLSNSLELQAL